MPSYNEELVAMLVGDYSWWIKWFYVLRLLPFENRQAERCVFFHLLVFCLSVWPPRFKIEPLFCIFCKNEQFVGVAGFTVS